MNRTNYMPGARPDATTKLSEEAWAARAPRPPEELVGALQDRIHPTSGRLLDAKPIRTTRIQQCAEAKR